MIWAMQKESPCLFKVYIVGDEMLPRYMRLFHHFMLIFPSLSVQTVPPQLQISRN